jgi:exonuclease III
MTQEQIRASIISSSTTIHDESGRNNSYILTEAALKDLVKTIHQQTHDYSCYAYSSGLTDGKDLGRLDNRW